ncbi:OprD family outer membrane porin [Marinobacterium mangrovicola]|uniref:Outer membrane OprD family porin n=1 Tax=Marinobacterium mangrovicola TaxID=1476959 RepID=A0A4R1GFZ6_9GAMM|nr:OprD family outer membrane porin [Marinobacterium mangrovicola]TCK04799.1 outer membrane OprD family porin [Marinobacterium mangrovicola]
MLKHHSRKTGISLAVAAALLSPLAAQAGFVEDSKIKLDLRNFYLDRNYDGDTPDVGSWSQAADLQFFSGYTDTTIQFGLDMSATGAYIFDSEGNDGSLPYDAEKDDTPDSYGRAGATLKAKYGETELTIGDHRPHLPVAWDDDSRVLDTIYEGAMLHSTAIDNLELTAGRFWEAVTRDSSDKEELYVFRGQDENRSDGLDFFGATYSFPMNIKGTYFFGRLNDFYDQHYYGLEHLAGFENGMKLKTDLRYFDYESEGKEYEGDMDVDVVSTMATLLAGNHMFALSYQNVKGDRPVPTLNGYIPQPYTVHWSSAAFIMPDERSWGVRYGYNFKDLGLPGMKLFTRYIKGTDIDIAGGTDESQSERDIYVSYEMQNAALKGLKFDLRSIAHKRSWADDYDEYRFITTYTFNF